MGCAGGKEEAAAPATKKSLGPPPPKSEAELEKIRKEQEEAKKWEAEAKRTGPPEPKKPNYKPGGSEDEYKNYMREKYEYEAWENQIVLLARKLKAQNGPK